jgi:hypothetical protein
MAPDPTEDGLTYYWYGSNKAVRWTEDGIAICPDCDGEMEKLDYHDNL